MINRNDMILRFGAEEIAKLTDHENYETIDDAVLQRAMDDAAAEAESYLSAAGYRHSDGLTPRVLVLKVCDMARYYLHEDGDIEIVEKRYKAAIEWLKQVAKNPKLLGVDAQTGVSEALDNQHAVRPLDIADWDADVHYR